MGVPDALTLYLASLSATHSLSTRANYGRVLRCYCRYAAQDTIEEFCIDAQARVWNCFILGRDLRPRSIDFYSRCVRLFLEWCISCKLSPGLTIYSPILPKFDLPTRPKLSRSEFASALAWAAAQQDLFLRRRDSALLHVLFFSFLRRAELLALRVSDIRLSDNVPMLFVYQGKGGQSAWLPLSDDSASALRLWLKERGECEHDSLWTKSGATRSRLGRVALYSLLDRVAHGAGVSPDHLTPHAFRRGGATSQLQAGVDIMTVSKGLRHANLATTQIYVEANSQRLIEVRNWGQTTLPGLEERSEKKSCEKVKRESDPRFRRGAELRRGIRRA